MSGLLHTMTTQDLGREAGALLRDAEEGHATILTEGGRAKAVVVPVDDRLLELGLPRVLALRLFAAGELTLEQAARLAEVSVGEMLDLLRDADLDAVSYPPGELDAELAIP
jgi:antitoxin (DNA-binding transcriptional repressor) of toxin-antitoxin stability system